jgi:predicted lipoprotein with Yx(FWY)xxD motif
VKQASCRLVALIATGVVVAACGSSSSTKSVPAAAAPATPSTGTSTMGTSASGATTLQAKKQGKLGTILAAGPKKLTVYLFEGDSGTTSHCTGRCAKAWPPVTTTRTPTGSAPVQSSLIGTTTRADGTKQVTYKGHPLYYFIKDKDGGDAYGGGVKAFGASWYALKPDGSKVDNT